MTCQKAEGSVPPGGKVRDLQLTAESFTYKIIYMLTRTIPIVSHTFEESGVPVSFRGPGHGEASGTSITGTAPGALARLKSFDEWPDAELIQSVRREPPDEAALDVLVARYWDTLFARCHLLTLNHEKALDLTQAAWCKLLRSRQALNPDGNFPAYLAMIATNLFRDSYRAARRAGPMAEYRLESLDAIHDSGEGDVVMFAEVIPDLKTLDAEERTLLAIDLDMALEKLSPQMREVLTARFIDGESCAEIGHRYMRTEQAVSGWVRAALRQMKAYLEESGGAPGGTDKKTSPERSRLEEQNELLVH